MRRKLLPISSTFMGPFSENSISLPENEQLMTSVRWYTMHFQSPNSSSLHQCFPPDDGLISSSFRISFVLSCKTPVIFQSRTVLTSSLIWYPNRHFLPFVAYQWALMNWDGRKVSGDEYPKTLQHDFSSVQFDEGKPTSLNTKILEGKLKILTWFCPPLANPWWTSMQPESLFADHQTKHASSSAWEPLTFFDKSDRRKRAFLWSQLER